MPFVTVLSSLISRVVGSVGSICCRRKCCEHRKSRRDLARSRHRSRTRRWRHLYAADVFMVVVFAAGCEEKPSWQWHVTQSVANEMKHLALVWWTHLVWWHFYRLPVYRCLQNNRQSLTRSHTWLDNFRHLLCPRLNIHVGDMTASNEKKKNKKKGSGRRGKGKRKGNGKGRRRGRQMGREQERRMEEGGKWVWVGEEKEGEGGVEAKRRGKGRGKEEKR